MRSRKKTGSATVIGIVLVTFFAALCILPLSYMFLLSLTQSETTRFALSDISFDFINYRNVIFRNDYGRALLNSVIVVVLSCIWTCLVSAMAGYGFEKKPVPGKEIVYKIFIATMMVPGQVTIIPLFIIMRDIGWLNSYQALVIPMAGAFGVMMMRSFIKSVPDVLIEAAQIDGCSEIYIFTRIVMPLVKPATVSLTIFTFVSAWNAFLWPLVSATKSDMHTLIVAMSLLDTKLETNYGLIMAGATITFIVPFVLYCFLQKQFVEGIALGGVKG